MSVKLKAVVSAALLSTKSTVFAENSQIGINHLSLDTSPGNNMTVCAEPSDIATKTGSNITPNNLTIAVAPFNSSSIKLIFTVHGILAQKESILFLSYSPQISPSPDIATPKSRNKLVLDASAMEILAMYNIPAQHILTCSSTRIGSINPSPHTAIKFSVNLNIRILPVLIENGDKAYFQAALLTKANYDEGRYDTMILSELDTLRFVENECPADHASVRMDEEGIMTVTNFDGNVVKTAATESVEAGAVYVGK
jgi:hypothetical protein